MRSYHGLLPDVAVGIGLAVAYPRLVDVHDETAGVVCVEDAVSRHLPVIEPSARDIPDHRDEGRGHRRCVIDDVRPRQQEQTVDVDGIHDVLQCIELARGGTAGDEILVDPVRYPYGEFAFGHGRHDDDAPSSFANGLWRQYIHAVHVRIRNAYVDVEHHTYELGDMMIDGCRLHGGDVGETDVPVAGFHQRGDTGLVDRCDVEHIGTTLTLACRLTDAQALDDVLAYDGDEVRSGDGIVELGQTFLQVDDGRQGIVEHALPFVPVVVTLPALHVANDDAALLESATPVERTFTALQFDFFGGIQQCMSVVTYSRHVSAAQQPLHIGTPPTVSHDVECGEHGGDGADGRKTPCPLSGNGHSCVAKGIEDMTFGIASRCDGDAYPRRRHVTFHQTTLHECCDEASLVTPRGQRAFDDADRHPLFAAHRAHLPTMTDEPRRMIRDRPRRTDVVGKPAYTHVPSPLREDVQKNPFDVGDVVQARHEQGTDRLRGIAQTQDDLIGAGHAVRDPQHQIGPVGQPRTLERAVGRPEVGDLAQTPETSRCQLVVVFVQPVGTPSFESPFDDTGHGDAEGPGRESGPDGRLTEQDARIGIGTEHRPFVENGPCKVPEQHVHRHDQRWRTAAMGPCPCGQRDALMQDRRHHDDHRLATLGIERRHAGFQRRGLQEIPYLAVMDVLRVPMHVLPWKRMRQGERIFAHPIVV